MARCIEEVIRASGGKLNKTQAEAIIKAVEIKFIKLKRSARDEISAGERTTQREPPLERDTRRPDTRGFEERRASADHPTTKSMEQLAAEHSGGKSDAELYQQAAKEAHGDAVNKAKLELRRQKLQIESTAVTMGNVARDGNGNTGVLEVLKRNVEGKGNAIANELITKVWSSLETFLHEKGTWGMGGNKPNKESSLELLTLLRDPRLSEKLAGNESKWTSTERLAYHMRLALEMERSRKNALGADIGKLQGYGGPQSWDSLSVKWFGLRWLERWQDVPGGNRERENSLMRKSRNAFNEFIFPHVDREQYQDETGARVDDETMKGIIDQIWNTIADHGAAKNQIGSDGKMVDGMASHRQLHLKDAASWYEVNSKIGTHDLIDGILGKLNKSGREIAMLETFGPYAERGYKTIQAWAAANESAYTGKGSKGTADVNNYFSELAGRNGGVNENSYAMITRTMGNIRTGLSAALLGSLPISQVIDAATLFSMAKYNTGSNKEMFEVLKILNPAAKQDRDLAKLHGFLADSMIHDMMRHMNQESTKSGGLVDKMAHLVMTVSGATLWTDALKLAGQLHSGYFLAKNRKLTFEQIDPFFKATLERYHIDAADWELIRGTKVTTLRGMEILTPAELFRMQHPLSMDVPAADAPALERQVHEAATKAVDLILAEADIMVLTPDAYTRSQFSGNPDRPLTNELVKSIWMFKSFSLAHYQKVLKRLASTEPGNTTTFKAELILSLLGAGAVAVQMQNLSMGKELDNMNPLDDPMKAAKFWFKAFVKSGGAGIYGEILMQDYSNFGENVGRAIAGPIGSMLTDGFQYTIGNALTAIQGKDPHMGADTVRLMRRYTPFANLYYARAALDHILFNKAQEALNPGYLRRMERRLHEQSGQEYWWKPSDPLPESPPDLSHAVMSR